MRKQTGTFRKVIKGTQYWVARHRFPVDKDTGKVRSPRDFYARTEGEAVAKRKAWADKFEQNPQADDSTTFGAYLLNEFVPGEEQRARLQATSPRKLSWARYKERKARLTRMTTSDAAKKLCATKIADLVPKQFELYLKGIEGDCTPSQFNKLRGDVRLAITGLRGRTRLPVSEFVTWLPAPHDERPAPKKLPDAADVVAKIADAKSPILFRALVAAQFILCCRPQELFALTWADVNWQTERVTIDKRVVQIEGGADVLTGSKTDHRGSRTIAMGPKLSALLRELQRANMTSPFVFGGLTKTRMRTLWPKIKASMKLDLIKFYDLKHLGNSWAQSQGVSPVVMASRMGHSSPRQALTSYRSVSAAEDRAAAEAW